MCQNVTYMYMYMYNCTVHLDIALCMVLWCRCVYKIYVHMYNVRTCTCMNMYVYNVHVCPLLQLLCLSQAHSIVTVAGACCSGKSSVIKVAADTLRGQGEGLTLSWIVPGALEEGELFGRDREG